MTTPASTPAVDQPVSDSAIVAPPTAAVSEPDPTLVPAPVAANAGEMVLAIPFNAKDAALVDRIARMRLRVMALQAPVDLGEYVRRLINQDAAACIREIQSRRGA